MVGALMISETTSMIVEFVDTNVWVYAVDMDDPRHVAAVELITRLTRDGNGGNNPNSKELHQRR